MALAAAASTPPPATLADHLEGFLVPADVAMANDDEGNIGAWRHDTGEVAVWDSTGVRRSWCRIEDPRLAGGRGELGLRGDRALLTFLEHPAGAEDRRRLAVVDLRQCKAVSLFSLPGLVLAVQPARDGWIVVSSPSSLQSRSEAYTLIDDRGRTVASFDCDDELERLARESGLQVADRWHTARAFLYGREVWLIPDASYELWRPRQRGRPFRSVVPPACLAASALELRGEENAQHVLALSRGWTEKTREIIAEGVRRGALAPSFLSAVAYHVRLGDLLAVVVRDPKTRTASRLDLWDMISESIVGLYPFPADARLVALGEGVIWIRDREGRMRRLPLAVLPEGLKHPCVDLEVVRAQAAHAVRQEPPRASLRP